MGTLNPFKDFDFMRNVPGQLAESENLLVWQISNRHLAVKWHQMMFAHGKHFNVFHDHHLVMILIENSSIQHI